MKTQMITPTEQEKSEWARFAQAAYAAGHNAIGHRASAAASLPRGGEMALVRFDTLQDRYRAWLVRNEWK